MLSFPLPHIHNFNPACAISHLVLDYPRHSTISATFNTYNIRGDIRQYHRSTNSHIIALSLHLTNFYFTFSIHNRAVNNMTIFIGEVYQHFPCDTIDLTIEHYVREFNIPVFFG